MSSSAARRALERLRHAEVLERLPGARFGDNAALAGRARAAFAFAHRAELERLLAGAGGEAALRGRILWLLGRRAEAAAALAGADGAEALAWRGAAFLASSPRRAERLLTRALRLAPRLREARVWRAAARLSEPKRWAEALSDLEGARGATALLLRAMACVQGRRWKEAERASTALIALEPLGQAGWSFRARARRALGNAAGAEADYHEARNRQPECDGRGWGALLRAERAEALRERGRSRFDLALGEYRALEPRLGGRAWFLAHFSRAEAPFAGLEASLRRLDRACRLFPSGGWLFAWRGETLRRLGRTREALRDLDRGVRLQPWYGYAHVWRAAALQTLGRWAESKEALDAGIAMEVTCPADAYALHLRSLARARLGDWAGAADDRTGAFLLNPKYAWPDDGPGLEALARALDARPGHAWTAAWSARRLPPAAADRALSEVLAREPGHAWARVWRAEARGGAGAEADLRAALRAEPGLCVAAERLAAALLGRGRAREALRVLEGAARSRPASARFFALRAEALRRLGRLAPAEESARAALALLGETGEAAA